MVQQGTTQGQGIKGFLHRPLNHTLFKHSPKAGQLMVTPEGRTDGDRKMTRGLSGGADLATVSFCKQESIVCTINNPLDKMLICLQRHTLTSLAKMCLWENPLPKYLQSCR